MNGDELFEAGSYLDVFKCPVCLKSTEKNDIHPLFECCYDCYKKNYGG